MSRLLRVLIIENSPEDAALLLSELQRGDYEAAHDLAERDLARCRRPARRADGSDQSGLTASVSPPMAHAVRLIGASANLFA